MARYSSFQRAFWQDDFVLELSPEEKFFYIYLFTNEQVTMCGIYKFSKKIACFETGYNLDTINKLIRRFIDYGKIVYSEETQEICLVNFIKNNYFTGKKISDLTIKGIQSNLAKVKNTNLIKYLQGLETLSIPLVNPMDIPCKPLAITETDNSNRITETETGTVTGKQGSIDDKTDKPVTREDNRITDFKTVKSVIEQKKRVVTSSLDGLQQEQVTDNSRRRLDVEYEELFSLYPKKTHHDTGFNAYVELYQQQQLPPLQALLDIVDKHKLSSQWQDVKYVPSIAKWLKDRRFKDELDKAAFKTDEEIAKEKHAAKVMGLKEWAIANGYKESEIFLGTTTAAYEKAMGLT